MELATLALEYLRVLLTAPLLFSIVAVVFLFKFTEDIKALLLRVAKIRFPDGTEVDMPQSSRIEESEREPVDTGEIPVKGIPPGLTQDQEQAITQLVRAQIATTYIWEYRYLNYFLARGTQMALDWFVGLSQPTTLMHYDSVFLPIVPSARERKAMFNALEAHHLVVTCDVASDMIAVTPKGQEYHQWRGALPPLTNRSTGPT